MYLVKKSKFGYIFDKLWERIVFMFLKDGIYFMYYDGRIFCYLLKFVDVLREEFEEFERMGELLEFIKRVKVGKYFENCVVKELFFIDKGFV